MYYRPVKVNGYYQIEQKEKRTDAWEAYLNLMGKPVVYAQKSLADADVKLLREAYGKGKEIQP